MGRLKPYIPRWDGVKTPVHHYSERQDLHNDSYVVGDFLDHEYRLSPRKLHPVLRIERAEKDRFTTGQKTYFFGCLMNMFLGVVEWIAFCSGAQLSVPKWVVFYILRCSDCARPRALKTFQVELCCASPRALWMPKFIFSFYFGVHVYTDYGKSARHTLSMLLRQHDVSFNNVWELYISTNASP